MPAVLSLDSSIEHLTQQPQTCPNARLWAEVIDTTHERHFTHKLRCKSWRCPYCQKINARVLRDEIIGALKAYAASRDISDPKLRYSVKLVTLTLPGAVWRASHTQEEAEKLIKKNLDKLLKMLRKSYHLADYVWVREFQSGGWSHIHLLMLGGDVWRSDVLDFVRFWWSDQYEMGNIDVKIVHDIEHAGRYLTKYMTKELETGLKSSRVYSMSRHFQQLKGGNKMEKKQRFEVLRVGVVNSDGSLGRVIWEKGEFISLDTTPEDVLFDLLKFFEDIAKPQQGDLF